jgi:ribonuclease P protein component
LNHELNESIKLKHNGNLPRIEKLRQNGRRGSRRDAISRARSGSILSLCIDVQRSTIENAQTVLEVAIVASKKQVSKKAVHRNLAKRRIRSALHQLDLASLSLPLSTHRVARVVLLLVCSRDTISVPFPRLLEDLRKSIERNFEQLLGRLGDFNEPNH